MQEVIMPGAEYRDRVKYLILNKEKQICKIIPVTEDSNLQEIENILNDILSAGFKVKSLKPLTFNEEIRFFWPQIITEFIEKFGFARSWLERARLFIKDEQVVIQMETEMAAVKLNKLEAVNFFQNKFYYFTDKRIDIKIVNGNFLKEIDENTDYNQKDKHKQQEQQHSQSKQSSNKPVGKTDKSENSGSKENMIIYGRKIAQKPTHEISEIESGKERVVLRGEIFDYQERKTRSGMTLIIISITDKKDSITAKVFLKNGKKLKGTIKEGDSVKLRGQIKYDSYNNELTVIVNDIYKMKPEQKLDRAPEKRIELHCHTKMSAMDAVSDVEEIIKRASEWGHPALAITDHGVVQAFPDAYQAGQKYGVKIIYGLEAYLVDDGKPLIVNPRHQNINDTEFVVFDLETTGLNPQRNEIIEIGAVKVKGQEIIDEFSTFVKPEAEIPAKITEITGIDGQMVGDAPEINEVAQKLIDFIDDAVLVAHNADFDFGFLRANIEYIEKNTENYVILDTLGLSRALLPQLSSHKLNKVAAHLQINLQNHHRAVNDARATAGILCKFLTKIIEKDINTLPEINNLTEDIDWKNLNPYHVIILAENEKGLKTLYKLVSDSHLNHFYRKPRVLKSKLIHNRHNLIIGSACESGQLFRSILENKSKREIEDIAKFYDFLEIQPVGNNEFLIPKMVDSPEEIQNINRQIYKLGQKLHKPVVATGDVHFVDPENKIYREILQNGQGYNNPEQQPPLYYRTTETMESEFAYLGQKAARKVVVENPKKINNRIEDMKPIPEGLYTPEIEGAEAQIREMSYKRAYNLYGDSLPEIIENRLEKELNAIIENGYAVIYLISHKLVKKSLEDGYLVGSRGSVGSSLAATMCEITEVNPLPAHYRCPQCDFVEFIEDEHISIGVDLPDKKCPVCNSDLIKDGYDIPFEVFMGFEGDKVPDIDLNFSGEYQGKIHQYTEDLFGRDYVFRAGTISTIANRTAFGFVRGYLDDNNINARKAEINRLVQGCTGVKKTTGQHPGGLMVVPRDKDMHDFSPVQHPANDQDTSVRTTHFDYHSISGRILKLDLLGHDDPTTLRMLQDLTGINPDTIPLDDIDTMSIFSGLSALDVSEEDIGTEIGSLGIPEFGTGFVQQMLVETRPTTFAELVRISGLSHGTDVWLNNARELIQEGQAELSEVISVRDDIMNYLIQKGVEPGAAFWIMEHVRKGKGLTPAEEKNMRDVGVPDWYVDSCKKIKYMFPKAHAAAYVMMAFRIAYFKVHYPEAFYTTYFTIKADDFDAHLISKGYDYICSKSKELENKDDSTAKDKGTLTVLQIVIEAMNRGIDFARVDLYDSPAFSFKNNKEGLRPPLISLQGLGQSAAANIAASREKGDFKSIEDLVNRTGVNKNIIEILDKHGAISDLPESNQLSLF